MKKMKFFASLLLLLTLILSLCACDTPEVEENAPANDGKTTTLYVYNWGEYISDGYEDSLDVNKAFEDYCRDELGINVKINYSTYSSNEDLYAKLASGTVSYDIVVPSDYMIARMINENLIQPIDMSKLKNYGNIDDEFKGLYYDPTESYSVAYTYGTVGIIYNTEMVPADLPTLTEKSWEMLWDEALSGKILQFNNPRDAFATAHFALGQSINTDDVSLWQTALTKLKEQKPVLQGYVMDEIFNKMKGNSAAAAPYYAGDFFTMYSNNEALDFFYPTGSSNVFVDAMCIPASSKNYDLALTYIDFMLREEIAIANAEYICYASPNHLVYENEEYIAYMEEEIHPNAMSVLYDFNMEDMEFFHDLSQMACEGEKENVLLLMNSLWEELKIESDIGTSVYVICGAIVAAVVALGVISFVQKKRREAYYD